MTWYDQLLERVFPLSECNPDELEKDYLAPQNAPRSYGPHNHGWPMGQPPDNTIYVPGGFFT